MTKTLLPFFFPFSHAQITNETENKTASNNATFDAKGLTSETTGRALLECWDLNMLLSRKKRVLKKTRKLYGGQKNMEKRKPPNQKKKKTHFITLRASRFIFLGFLKKGM
jgi:ethanolamine ammonia-lyase large subunit